VSLSRKTSFFSQRHKKLVQRRFSPTVSKIKRDIGRNSEVFLSSCIKQLAGGFSWNFETPDGIKMMGARPIKSLITCVNTIHECDRQTDRRTDGQTPDDG